MTTARLREVAGSNPAATFFPFGDRVRSQHRDVFVGGQQFRAHHLVRLGQQVASIISFAFNITFGAAGCRQIMMHLSILPVDVVRKNIIDGYLSLDDVESLLQIHFFIDALAGSSLFGTWAERKGLGGWSSLLNFLLLHWDWAGDTPLRARWGVSRLLIGKAAPRDPYSSIAARAVSLWNEQGRRDRLSQKFGAGTITRKPGTKRTFQKFGNEQVRRRFFRNSGTQHHPAGAQEVLGIILQVWGSWIFQFQ